MKKLPQVALVGAGSLEDSLGRRLVDLPRRLGPIKSTSVRVASRLSNALRAGRPVADYQSLECCKVVFVSVPREAIEATIREMAASGLCWKGRLVLLWSKELGVEALDPLVRQGAETASLCMVPGFDEDWFLLEGGKALEHRLRPLLGGRGVKVMLVAAGQKVKCVRGLAELTRQFGGMLRESAEGLRNAGVSTRDLERALERQINLTFRSCFRSGRLGKPSQD